MTRGLLALRRILRTKSVTCLIQINTQPYFRFVQGSPDPCQGSNCAMRLPSVSLAEVSPPKRRVRSNLESRRQTAWVARPFCANNPNTVSWGGILKGLPLRGAPASGGGVPIACGVDCALSPDLFLLKRFFSLSLFLLLDEPQPRKTNGEDHHHDQNGVLNHRSDPELMLTDQRRPK